MRRPSVTGELAYQLAQRQFGVPCLQALLHRARFGKLRIEGRRATGWSDIAHGVTREPSGHHGDRVQLQQVIINLLRNACEAVHAIDDRPREIEIRIARDEGERVRLSVRDSGVGFDADSAEKLFDAFYTTKHEGMGIGLSVCRSIIENHGGRLWAMVNDGPGGTVAFSIPVAADDALPPSARQLASTSLMS